MSDRIKIVAEPRTVTGKKVKQLRREGYIPGVIYGQSEPVHVQMEEIELRRALRTAGTTQLASIEVGGREYTVLAREIQQHVVRRDILHVDFMEVRLDVKITAEATVVSEGMSPVEEEGLGSVTLPLHSVQIEALPDDLISELTVDVSQIQAIDDVIYVRDLPRPDNVEILTDPDTVVARFEIMREEEEEEVEEELLMPAADEVEVIGEAEEEEGTEEEAI